MKLFKNIVLFLLSLYTLQTFAVTATDTIAQTEYFSFHNNKWMNIHHFLFEKASHEQKKYLAKDSLDFINIQEEKIYAQLSAPEKKTLQDCIAYYTTNIIDQPLLHSAKIFKWLQKQAPVTPITDTTLSQEYTNTLNKVNTIYEKHFWKTHKKQNDILLTPYLKIIKQTETQVIHKMEELSGNRWKGQIRIDITTYGNWASAYSPDLDNIVISSIDPLLHSTLFIEFVFHESSHLLFLRSSPFRKSIYDSAKEQDIAYSKNLWHAAMFYLSGIVTKDVLKTINLKHDLIMKKKNVYGKYYTNTAFKKVLNTYYNKKASLNETALQLVQLNL